MSKIILCFVLLLYPIFLSAAPLYHTEESVDLTFRFPKDWRKVRDPAQKGQALGSYYTDPQSIGQLKISVEDCPVDDISLVPWAMKKAMNQGAMRLSGEPRLARIGHYPCVVLDVPQKRGALTPAALFVHYLVGNKEIAFRLAGIGPQWKAVKEEFLLALEELHIGLLPRDCPPGPIKVVENHSAVVVAPSGFRPLKKVPGDVVARFTEPQKERLFDITWHKRPLLTHQELAESFLLGLTKDGFNIKNQEANTDSYWPAVKAETETIMGGTEVTIFFYLLFLPHRVYQVSGTCHRKDAKAYRDSFFAAARAFRVGGPRPEAEFYHNPSFMTNVGENRVATIEWTAKIREAREAYPMGTLATQLTRNFPPYQSVKVLGWSQTPNHLSFDEWNNLLAAFYLNDVGKRARQRVTIKMAVTVKSMTIEVENGKGLRLPPHIEHLLTSPTRNIPLCHPRIGVFAKSALKDVKMTPKDVINALLNAVAATAPGPAGSQIIKEWGRGALFAVAKPEEAGASERVDLLTALLRERKLPTRRIYGHLLPRKGEKGALIPHCWCEVYLPPAGWIPLDPTPLINGVPPQMGHWSDRYVCSSIEGPGNVEKQGPDAVRMWRGHCLPNINELPVLIEVTRKVD